jgi:hypothetical protein
MPVRKTRAITEERRKAAVKDARKLLKPLAEAYARLGSVVTWNDSGASDPRDLFECAVEYVIALLDPAPPPEAKTHDRRAQLAAKTYDPRAQQAADEFLGIQAPIVREVVLPALRLGRLPKGKGRRRGGNLLRDRWIAAVVATICQRHGLSPYKNEASKHTCNGCSIVVEALNELGIDLDEKTVKGIYMKHRRA